jgi:hypothetical protein
MTFSPLMLMLPAALIDLVGLTIVPRLMIIVAVVPLSAHALVPWNDLSPSICGIEKCDRPDSIPPIRGRRDRDQSV